MLFSSLVFLWLFLPLVLILYRLLPAPCKNALLLAASLLFYAWGEPKYILLMLGSITLNYLGGLLLVRLRGRAKTAALVLVVAANLALLGYYKYYSFAGDTLAALLHRQVLPVREIALPLGISFYTFQAMSYIIDLYRGSIRLQKNWFLLALYISFFPQLVAGPIVRYSEVEAQLRSRTADLTGFCYGIKRFLYGLSKKVILSNCFAARADEVFGLSPELVSTPLAWLGALYYTLQIYYDFSGYSDMAIGLGAMFGFTFPENFNYPYLSKTVSEFWRRWHMTLSGWFREYLYIPLGGSRNGQRRTLFNLCGLGYVVRRAVDSGAHGAEKVAGTAARSRHPPVHAGLRGVRLGAVPRPGPAGGRFVAQDHVDAHGGLCRLPGRPLLGRPHPAASGRRAAAVRAGAGGPAPPEGRPVRPATHRPGPDGLPACPGLCQPSAAGERHLQSLYLFPLLRRCANACFNP